MEPAGLSELIAAISVALSADNCGDFILETGSLMKVQPDSTDNVSVAATRHLRLLIFNFITLSLIRVHI
ncbi:hypothetical protein D3C78_1126880 [compost metagenome]